MENEDIKQETAKTEEVDLEEADLEAEVEVEADQEVIEEAEGNIYFSFTGKEAEPEVEAQRNQVVLEADPEEKVEKEEKGLHLHY